MLESDTTESPQPHVIFIRKSHLESYDFCPQQFFKQFIEQKNNPANQKMLIGTRFHEFAHTFFDYALAFQPEDWFEFIPYEDLNDEEVAMYEWFIQYQIDRYHKLEKENRLDEFQLVYKELFMTCAHVQLQSTVDGAYWVDKSKNQIGLIEYKTGAKPGEDAAFRQLAFYAYLWTESGLPGKIVELLLINPRLQLVLPTSYNDMMAAAAKRRITTLRTAIDTGIFPYKCSDGKYAACKLCDIQELGHIFPDDGMERFSDVYDNPQLTMERFCDPD